MPLPPLNQAGDLPEGIHAATLEELVARFGSGRPQRQAVTARLIRLIQLASGTGQVDRLIIFGSYITAKPEPNDLDVVLVMRDDFQVAACEPAARLLFVHSSATEAFGASVFWVRPAMLLLETVEEFLAAWQLKRDGTRRGIVEVRG